MNNRESGVAWTSLKEHSIFDLFNKSWFFIKYVVNTRAFTYKGI